MRQCDLGSSSMAEIVRGAGASAVGNPIVLATGDSDSSAPSEAMPEARAILDSPKILHWYSQNYDGVPAGGRISPLPIGNDFHTISEKPFWGMGVSSPREQERLLNSTAAALRPRKERIPRIYVDFAWQGAYATRPLPGAKIASNRGEIVQMLLRSKQCFFQSNPLPRLDLWRKMGEYAFVFSPHGNGLDCHRTWEALSLGHIVIAPSSSLDSLYTGLPVVCVDRFDDITDEKLDHWLREFEGVAGDHKKLTSRYWSDRMRSRAQADETAGKVLHRFDIGGICVGSA